MCADKGRGGLIEYYINGGENNLSTSEKNEKSRGGYVYMYECVKHLVHSSYERACVSYETIFSEIKEVVGIFKSEIKETIFTNRDMKNYIDSCNKASEKCVACP